MAEQNNFNQEFQEFQDKYYKSRQPNAFEILGATLRDASPTGQKAGSDYLGQLYKQEDNRAMSAFMQYKKQQQSEQQSAMIQQLLLGKAGITGQGQGLGGRDLRATPQNIVPQMPRSEMPLQAPGLQTDIPLNVSSVTAGGVKAERDPLQMLSATEKIKKGIAYDDKKLQAISEARKTNQSVQLATKMFGDGMIDVVRESQDVLKDKFDITLDPSRGLQGKAFAFLQDKLGKTGYNSYFDSVAKGMTNELAAEFAKAGGASRLGFFIMQAFKDTIPKLDDETVESGGFQLTKSSTNAYRKYLKEAYPDESFEDLADRLFSFEEKTTKDILGGFEDSGIYKPQVYEFEANGETYRMPSYMIKFWAKRNEVKLKDIDKKKKLVS